MTLSISHHWSTIFQNFLTIQFTFGGANFVPNGKQGWGEQNFQRFKSQLPSSIYRESWNSNDNEFKHD